MPFKNGVMSRRPEYNRPLTDSTNLAVIQGRKDEVFLISYGDLKSQIISSQWKAGEVTFASNAFSVSFAKNVSSANYVINFTELPDDVNVTTSSIVKTTSGFSGTYIGVGAGTGFFTATVINN